MFFLNFSYLILSASCSVFSLISTMTWDTGFNIRLSTFICKNTTYSDSVSTDSTQESHTVVSKWPHSCSAPAARSSPCARWSSAQAPLSMSSLQGLADSLIQPLEYHWSAATQPKLTFLFYIMHKGHERQLCGTTTLETTEVLLAVCEREEEDQSLDGSGCWIRCVV